MELDTLQSLLGWCLAINMALYLMYVAMMLAAREWIVRRHGKWFAVEPDRLRPILYQFLGAYKLLIIVLNFAPWLAVVIVNR